MRGGAAPEAAACPSCASCCACGIGGGGRCRTLPSSSLSPSPSSSSSSASPTALAPAPAPSARRPWPPKACGQRTSPSSSSSAPAAAGGRLGKKLPGCASSRRPTMPLTAEQATCRSCDACARTMASFRRSAGSGGGGGGGEGEGGAGDAEGVVGERTTVAAMEPCTTATVAAPLGKAGEPTSDAAVAALKAAVTLDSAAAKAPASSEPWNPSKRRVAMTAVGAASRRRRRGGDSSSAMGPPSRRRSAPPPLPP